MIPPAPSQKHSRWRRALRWVLAGFAVCCVATAIGVYNLITLSSEATALRRELVSEMASQPHLRVQVSVGPMLLSAVRTSLGFIHDVPAEARLALRGVEKASVGVYEIDQPLSPPESSRMFDAADKMMDRRGWTRVVGVKDDDTLVLVYFPKNQNSNSTERVCVAVCADKHLVVVSGKLRFEPLVQLALQQRLLASR